MPPSRPSRVEQRVPVEEEFVEREESMTKMATSLVSEVALERFPYPKVEGIREGAVSEIPPLSDVSPSSVITSSIAAQRPNDKEAATPRGTHESSLISPASATTLANNKNVNDVLFNTPRHPVNNFVPSL